MLEDVIIDVLSSMSKPIPASRVLHFVMTHSPTMRFSWSDFVDALCHLVAVKRIEETTDGYSTVGVVAGLDELGL